MQEMREMQSYKLQVFITLFSFNILFISMVKCYNTIAVEFLCIVIIFFQILY